MSKALSLELGSGSGGSSRLVRALTALAITRHLCDICAGAARAQSVRAASPRRSTGELNTRSLLTYELT